MLREVLKENLSTDDVYDSALPWSTVSEMCVFKVMVMTALFIIAAGQAKECWVRC